MTPHQARRARTILKWSLSDTGNAARVSSRAVADLEEGRPVSRWTEAAIQSAYEAEYIRFVDTGWLAGGIIRSRLRFTDEAYRASVH